jgi:hypothetical protein
MILIDYAPGLHGFFLEFVVNKYLFGADYSVDSIFQKSGACHEIIFDKKYQQHKVVTCDHYSSISNKKEYSQDINKIIFIKHNPILDFVLLVNIFYRCHPEVTVNRYLDSESIIEYHLNSMLNNSSDKELRNDWFTKLSERHFADTEKKAHSNVPVFDFDFGAFFDLSKFLLELQRLSKYLDVDFKFDVSLVKIWNEFIEKNQGFQLYKSAQNLLCSIYNNDSMEIPNDWKLHAYIYTEIVKTFNVHDSEFFDLETYSTNTQQIYKKIVNFKS